MKKWTILSVTFLILFSAGYVLGRRHHIAEITIDPAAVELVIGTKVARNVLQPELYRASYLPADQQTQGGGHPHTGKLLKRYADLRKEKDGQFPATVLETWSTCNPQGFFLVKFELMQEPDNDKINIAKGSEPK